MELRDLRYFATIAATGHISRAAQQLRITQPALSKSVARLEHELGARLLERTPKGVSVTPVGQSVLRHAMRIRAATDDALRECADVASGKAGHLRIGTGLAMAQFLVPAACARLLAVAPDVTIDIVAGTGRGLLPALRDGDLDVVLSGLPPRPEPGFAHEPIMEDDVVVIARRRHPLHRRRASTLAKLARERWIVSRSDSLLSEWLQRKWQDAGLTPPKPVVRTDSMSTLLSLVAATDLVTFHSWSTIRHSPMHDELRPLANSAIAWRRRLGATYREGAFVSSAMRRLTEILVELGARER